MKLHLDACSNLTGPYCARVMLALEVKGIPYDTVLVDLRNKPQWYLKAVPTGLTPACRIKGVLMWESAGEESSLFPNRCFLDILSHACSVLHTHEACMGYLQHIFSVKPELPFCKCDASKPKQVMGLWLSTLHQTLLLAVVISMLCLYFFLGRMLCKQFRPWLIPDHSPCGCTVDSLIFKQLLKHLDHR